VAAGHGIAERSAITGYDDRVATVTVADKAWQGQLRSTAPQLQAELARISGVPLTDILFLLPADAIDTSRAQAAVGEKPRKPRTRKPS
jgi:predicted nucleic acid-binding Zn ribbon protein